MKQLYIILLVTIIIVGCDKEETSTNPPQETKVTVTDAQLVQLAKANTGFVFYKFSADTLLRANGSGHMEPKLRTRYNTKAATQLTDSGKVKSTALFPDSSLIVKELYNADGTLNQYAFMFKLSKSDNADANGWVWANIMASGTASYSVSMKGAMCTSCHSIGVANTRMNDSHP